MYVFVLCCPLFELGIQNNICLKTMKIYKVNDFLILTPVCLVNIYICSPLVCLVNIYICSPLVE